MPASTPSVVWSLLRHRRRSSGSAWSFDATPAARAELHDLYPERHEPPPEGWLERIGSAGLSRLQRYRRARPQRALAFPVRVAAAEATWGRLDRGDLARCARELRPALLAEGLSDFQVARAFALVRRAAELVLGKRHYDVQLIGGWVMVQGMVAEMHTGEGKTLTATLAACTAAWAGLPTHVITVNDYLVQRDCEAMRPLYEALGLSVATVTEDLSPDARRAAYACDVVYCCNKTVVFDYLRDRIALGPGHRPCAGPLQLQVERLAGSGSRRDALLLRGLAFAIVDEADSVLVDEARVPLIISAERGGPEDARLAAEAMELASSLTEGAHFKLLRSERRVLLTDAGRLRVSEWCEGRDGPWSMHLRREELALRALSAAHLYQRDEHYLVRDGKVQVIDEFTGRVMADRSWGQGLHQLIEVKEGCAVTPIKETLARMSYQRFFRRYLHLGGMTGTAQEIRAELGEVYGLPVVKVPTRLPVRRQVQPDRIYVHSESRWNAVAQRVFELQAQGVPVLVGTRSVAASEHLGRLLAARGLPHSLLNARQDADEASVVSAAGEAGRITVATNMAGRGTDIALGPGVAERGGLHVILTERHEAARIDRQLAGRCARQGDPGSFEAHLALDDPLFVAQRGGWLHRLVRRFLTDGEPASRLLRAYVRWVQWRIERSHHRVRRSLLESDQRLDVMLSFSGRPE